MDRTCGLCGGNAGWVADTRHGPAHNLCAALKDAGLPTPCLGYRCTKCGGAGVLPKSPTGPALFLSLGPATISKAINAWAPPCDACDGKGHTESAVIEQLEENM